MAVLAALGVCALLWILSLGGCVPAAAEPQSAAARLERFLCSGNARRNSVMTSFLFLETRFRVAAGRMTLQSVYQTCRSEDSIDGSQTEPRV